MNDKKTKIPNGTFTLENIAKGSYITLKIHTVKGGDLKGKRIVSRLVGPDNETSYKGFAFITDNDKIVVWKKQRTDKNWQIVNILRNMLIHRFTSKHLDRISIKASTNCLRCNRKLTTPQSIADGFGPECVQKGML